MTEHTVGISITINIGERVFKAHEKINTEDVEEVASIVKLEMEKAGRMFLKDMPCIAEVTISDHWKK